MTCQRCRTARYCQKSCQTADWKRKDGPSHREVCNELRDVGKASRIAGQSSGLQKQDDEKDEEDAEKLLVACCEENLSNFINLLKSRVDPNHVCLDHAPILWGMCDEGKTDVVSALLSNGANPNYIMFGQTPLHRACQHGHTAIVKALVIWDADVCAAYDDGVTALHIACREGDPNMISELFSGKGPTVEVDKHGKTGLDYAREAGYDSIVNLITEIIERRHRGKDDGMDAVKLLDAYHKGNLSDVEGLLVDEVDPNHACQDHHPALFVMCVEGRAGVVSALVSNGADPNLVAVGGETALHMACNNGHIATVLVLIHWNADVYAANDGGLTALHAACSNGHTILAQLLVSYIDDLLG
jgi:ankyrin repeat protein